MQEMIRTLQHAMTLCFRSTDAISVVFYGGSFCSFQVNEEYGLHIFLFLGLSIIHIAVFVTIKSEVINKENEGYEQQTIRL